MVIIVRDQGVVHLQHQAGVDDRAVLFPQRIGERHLILLRRAIVLVRNGVSRVRRRDRGHETLLRRAALERCLQVLDIRQNVFLPDVADRSGADHLGPRRAAGRFPRPH